VDSEDFALRNHEAAQVDRPARRRATRASGLRGVGRPTAGTLRADSTRRAGRAYDPQMRRELAVRPCG